MEHQDKQEAAEKRLKQQQAFKTMAHGMVILWLVCWAIWAFSKGDGNSGFWPLWVMFGTGIAIAYSGWAAYGPRNSGPSESKIQNEIKKMD